MIVSFEICIMFDVIKDVPDVDILCVVSVVVVSTATKAKKKKNANECMAANTTKTCRYYIYIVILSYPRLSFWLCF